MIQATATPSPLDKSNRTDSLLPGHFAAQRRVDYITVKLVYTWKDQKENHFMKQKCVCDLANPFIHYSVKFMEDL